MNQLAPRLPDDDRRTRESGIYLTAIRRPAPTSAGMPVAQFVILFSMLYALTAWAMSFVR